MTQAKLDMTDETSDETFDDAVAAAQDAAHIRVDDDDLMAIPFAEYEAGTLAYDVAWAAAPHHLLLDRVFNEPDAHEVDGMGPTTPRHAQTFIADAQLDGSDDEHDTFTMLTKYQNRFNDLKIVVDAPAPWKAPDDLQAPNDLIKSIGEWEDHHWDMAEPSSVGVNAEDKVWTLDASAIQPLQEAVENSGYEWVDATGEEADDENDAEDVLDAVAAFAESGDTIRVRYDMAKGDGVGEKAGRVDAAYEGNGRGVTKAVSFTRDDGHANRLKYDDNNQPSIFSGGRYPYMGEILSVTVEPADGE